MRFNDREKPDCPPSTFLFGLIRPYSVHYLRLGDQSKGEENYAELHEIPENEEIGSNVSESSPDGTILAPTQWQVKRIHP